MSEYAPPLDDMKFTLKEVADIDSLEDFPSFTDIGLDSLDDLLEEAAKFFSQVISPTNRTGDLQGS
ncbi:MAG: acyl-CoA dehydrogenase N-terminal domain-containing protein, partial [Actinomycetota bacterium]|nr:acyl-CoA dehydrogenase N-terminal domain-containing protein [Actinomycetota bacterium]